MIKTTLFRLCFLLAGMLFFTTQADAQSKMSKNKSKSSKEVKAKEDVTDDEEEEVEYYWAYNVLDVVGKDGNLDIEFDKATLNSNLKMSVEQRDIAKKAASGGLRFTSDLEFITFMASQDYELVSVVSLNKSGVPAKRMYFRIQLEREK